MRWGGIKRQWDGGGAWGTIRPDHRVTGCATTGTIVEPWSNQNDGPWISWYHVHEMERLSGLSVRWCDRVRRYAGWWRTRYARPAGMHGPRSIPAGRL